MTSLRGLETRAAAGVWGLVVVSLGRPLVDVWARHLQHGYLWPQQRIQPALEWLGKVAAGWRWYTAGLWGEGAANVLPNRNGCQRLQQLPRCEEVDWRSGLRL